MVRLLNPLGSSFHVLYFPYLKLFKSGMKFFKISSSNVLACSGDSPILYLTIIDGTYYYKVYNNLCIIHVYSRNL